MDLAQTCTEPETLMHLAFMRDYGLLRGGHAVDLLKTVLRQDPAHLGALLELGSVYCDDPEQ